MHGLTALQSQYFFLVFRLDPTLSGIHFQGIQKEEASATSTD
jgi:hypothetical protein